MAIGTNAPDERKTFTDPETNRQITQFTSAKANNYPLYYFIPSHTADGQYLVFHSERTGWVQLYRLDLASGEIVQLTDGKTRDSGWGIPGMGYVHTGFDPEGRFLFYENQDGDTHELISVHFPHHPDRFRLNRLKRLTPIVRGQRYHAHPFLDPARKHIFYTDVLDGFSQICALNVEDLVDLNEYWDCR